MSYIHKIKRLNVKTYFLFIVTLTLTGCGAIHTAVDKRDLDVQTKMSSTVWLDPVPADKRTVFLQLRNTSDKQGIQFADPVKQAIISKGYQVVDDPDSAHYWIQANVLQVGLSDLRDSEDLFGKGYGSAVTGAAIGAQFGDGGGQVAAGVVGAAIGLAADAMVDDNLYTMITDLQISEKAKAGVVVTENNNATLKQGTSGHKSVTSSETVDRKKYQTRIISTANQANLEFKDAQPALLNGLVTTISGIL